MTSTYFSYNCSLLQCALIHLEITWVITDVVVLTYLFLSTMNDEEILGHLLDLAVILICLNDKYINMCRYDCTLKAFYIYRLYIHLLKKMDTDQ